jgi:cytidylate kinase
MGPSGAGKTTLLSILAKKQGASVSSTGKVFFCVIFYYRLWLMVWNIVRGIFIILHLLFIKMIF